MTKLEKGYKAKIVFGIVFIFLLLISFIGITAYNSKIQYEINMMNAAISEELREVQDLQLQIKRAANITNLESRAFELGLVYPEFDRIVYLHPDADNIEDFALALKESAYN